MPPQQGSTTLTEAQTSEQSSGQTIVKEVPVVSEKPKNMLQLSQPLIDSFKFIKTELPTLIKHTQRRLTKYGGSR